MTEVTIGIRAFPYYVTEPDPTGGEDRVVEKIARRGEKVDLSDTDLARAEKFGAIRQESDEPQEPEFDVGSFEIQTATAAQTAEWIKETKPTVEETVDEANNDADLARKLLEAENLATGGQPRKGVVDGLNEIIEADGGGG